MALSSSPASRVPVSRRRIAGLAAAAVLVAGCAGLVAVPAQAASTDLSIDASKVIRPVTRVADGGLYALADADTPSVDQLLPLRMNQLTQPAPGVTQLGNGAKTPTGDALKVAPSMIAAGAQETVRLPDIYPDFPYHWVSWDNWLSKVDTMIKARVAADTTTNINGYELWNEPDGTWDTAKAGPFTDGWTRTYNEVRKFDTVTPVVGPSISSYNHDYMLTFLTAAKASNTVPDVISWHLWSSDALPGELADLHAIEDSLGIGRRPVSINEYAWTDQVDVPSASLRYLATFERATDVRDAERPYWFESGTVNGLLHDDKPTSSYWLYQWYGGMAGNMVSVAQNGAQDGIAALDSTRKILDAVVGGASGDNTVTVSHLDGFGDHATVSLAYTPTSGRMANTAAPTTVWTKTLPISNGTLSVPIAGQDSRGAYHLVVTPATGPTTAFQQTYEAENASVVNAARLSSTGASNGGYVGGLDHSGDARNDSFVDFIVEAPAAGDYGLAVRYANGTGATSTQGLSYNGGSWSTLSYPATSGWGQFSSVDGPTLHLKKGYNTIRIAKGSPYFAGGTAFAELDSITLTPPADLPTAPVPPAATFVSKIEAEDATVSDGKVYSSSKASGAKYVGGLDNADSYVQFPLTAPADGKYKLTIGYANGGSFTQNGTTDAVQDLSVNDAAPAQLDYPASGSWGGNGGAFDATVTTVVELKSGANTVRLTHDANQNYAELDYAQISSPSDAVVDGRTTQKIIFPPVTGASLDGPDVNLAATASSGLPVRYRATGACSIVDGKLHPLTAGSCTVTASQAGDTTYAPAPDVNQTVTITAAATITPTITGSSTPTNGWYRSQVVIALTSTGAGTIQYRVDGGTWRTYSKSFTVSGNGTHTIDDRLLRSNVVVDGSTGTFQVKIDQASPSVANTRRPSSGTGTPRNPVTLALSATDSGSGVDALTYQVNGGDWTPAGADGTVSFSTVGDYSISYRATDKAGNVSSSKSTTVKITADPDTSVKTSKSATAGGYITVKLTGYHRNAAVDVTLGSNTLGTTTTDANGSASVTLKVPTGTTKGTYTLTAAEQDTTLSSSTSIKIS